MKEKKRSVKVVEEDDTREVVPEGPGKKKKKTRTLKRVTRKKKEIKIGTMRGR